MARDEFTSERRSSEFKRERFEEALAELTPRLARVCGHMSPAAFATLTATMARIQVKYEGIRAWVIGR
jgi:hypothetical protein